MHSQLRRSSTAPSPSVIPAASLPSETVIYGFPVAITREEGEYFIQSLAWDSLVSSAETYPKAQEEFLQLLKDVYASYSQNSDDELNDDAIMLRDVLKKNKDYFFNAD